MNQICLYSNGLGVFQREYALESGQPLRIAIPVPTNTLDEAITSIGVFGDVTLTEPPSFVPINTVPRGIELDPIDVIKDIARKMRGALATIQTDTKSVRGLLAGLQEYDESDGNTTRSRFRIALFEEDGTLRSVADNEIQSLKFADTAVQAEIEKALRRAFERVKPDSSYINLTVTPNAPEINEVIVQYVLANMGAWKIGYRLRSNAGKWELEGQAVVDNSTDDAWDNVLVSVVTGQPISFATDIAEIRLVRRNKENIVSEEALGAYEMEYDLSEEPAQTRMLSASAPMSGDADVFRGWQSPEQGHPVASMKRAIQETAEVKETTEIVSYTARRPVSIAANQSAVIPMFETALEHAKKLLVYNQNQHPTRPYRAVELVNEAGHGLGKGVVTLYEDGDYIGKAILKETAAGDKQILPYALEARVLIDTTHDNRSYHTARIKISRSVAVTETVQKRDKRYVVHNPHAEPFTIEIEHTLQLGKTVDAKLSTDETPALTNIEGGKRIRFSLPADKTVMLTCTESHTSSQSVQLKGELDASWFATTLLDKDKTLADNPVIQECIALQKERDAIEAQLYQNDRTIEEILRGQGRLKELITVGGLPMDMEEWRGDLGKNEREIREIKALQPELRAQSDAIKARLQEALGKLAITWNADNSK